MQDCQSIASCFAMVESCLFKFNPDYSHAFPALFPRMRTRDFTMLCRIASLLHHPLQWLNLVYSSSIQIIPMLFPRFSRACAPAISPCYAGLLVYCIILCNGLIWFIQVQSRLFPCFSRQVISQWLHTLLDTTTADNYFQITINSKWII